MTEENERHRRDDEDLLHAAEQEQAAHTKQAPPASARTPSAVARRGSLEVSRQ
jgi:hypothetical protein